MSWWRKARGVPKREQCWWDGCELRGRPAFLGADLCDEHDLDRDRLAARTWVDPATLTRERYDGFAPQGYYRATPCSACGHLGWTHMTTGAYDGPCRVTGCTACDGNDDLGHAPGFLPGVVTDAPG